MNKGEMVQFKKNKRTKFYSALPSLSWTFRLGGYINTSLFEEDEGVVMPFCALIIHVITKDQEEVKSACPAVYPCSPDFKLDNWSIVEIPVT